MPATPGVRLKLAMAFGVVLLSGLAVAALARAYLGPWMERLESADFDALVREEPAELVRLARVVWYGGFGALAAAVAGIGMYFVRAGRRILTSGQVPAPGTWVLRETRIIRGPKAVLRGRVTAALGAILVLVSIGAVAYVLTRGLLFKAKRDLKRL